MLKVIISVICLLAIAVAAMAVKIIVVKDGRFPQTHISANKAMKQKGIGCVQSQDRQEQLQNNNRINVKQL
ncbi:MAG TPA: hypothetical protein DEO38_00645 [Bacteroidales bacterium]|nr:hypothetical protein [Bacteroidales bacterium]